MNRHFGPPPGVKAFFKSRFVLPAVVAALQVAGAAIESTHRAARSDLDALAIGLLIAGPLVLTMRRNYPVQVMFAVFGIAGVYELMGYVDGPTFPSLVVAVVAAVVHGHRAIAIGMVAVAYIAFIWGDYFLDPQDRPELAEAIGIGAWLVAIFTITEVVRVRRERFVEAMRSRAEERRRQASEERLRMAQELHDVLAHNISLINVQAGTALHLLDDRPEQARPALGAIKDASNQALNELRSVLDLLREGPGAPLSPTAGLDQLEDLVDRTRSTGLEVATSIEGERRTLPAPVDRAAFRIVQESLTNVTRHAQASRAAIELAYGADALVIEITDDGRGTTTGSDDGGSGIAGMRERARSLGGDLTAQPMSAGGFRVRARLPYETEMTEDAE